MLLAACTGSGPEQASFTVADSGGVRVAYNRPGGEVLELRQLGAAALLRLGSEAAGSPELFGRIEAVDIAPDGSLWVTDGMSAELRVFDLPSGRHRFTVGGPGAGPGEFRRPVLVGFGGGDDAFVWDQELARLTRFSLAGELRDVVPHPRDREFVPRVVQRNRSGALVAQLPRAFGGHVRDGMLLQDTLRLWALDDDAGEPRLLAEAQGVTWFFADGVQAPVPFREGSRFAVRDDRIVLTDHGGAPALDVVENGRRVRRIHVERPREPVTAAALASNLDGPTRAPEQAALIRRRLDDLEIPAAMPTWQWLRIAPDGSIYALRYGTLFTNEVWDVFDADGRLTGEVSLTGEAHLMHAGGEYLVVLEMPELSGPSLAVHRR